MMKSGDPCPRCGSTVQQRYQWKPDLASPKPKMARHRCYDCGWDSGWKPWAAR